MRIGKDNPFRITIGIGYFECQYWGLGLSCQKYYGMPYAKPGDTDKQTGLFRSYTLWVFPIYINVRHFDQYGRMRI